MRGARFAGASLTRNMQKTDMEDILAKLTPEELCGQLFCFDIYEKDDPAKVEKVLRELHPGGIFVKKMSAEKIKLYTDMANTYSPVPVIVAADVENGPGAGVAGMPLFPSPMAWGACGDAALIEKAGVLTARLCRDCGIHWTFAPVVDLNFNFRSPETNIRAVSDSPDAVIEYAGAYSRGLRSEGLMATGAKHFPGGGTDERNSHFCTAINPLGRDEWLETYGTVYREMFRMGTDSVMVGHYSLPAFMPEEERHLPAVVSKSLMTDLLKGMLGFTGCVISDAMSMIGACSVVPCDRLAVEFVKAGGDMVLFPEDGDGARLLRAVQSGEISHERLFDALRRILALKARVGLLNGNASAPCAGSAKELQRVSQQIADKSITVVRNADNVLPVRTKKGDKALIVAVSEPYWHEAPTAEQWTPLCDELQKGGMTVDILINPGHKKVREVMGQYDLLLVACDMSSENYHGGSLRVGWYNIMTFWRAYILEHPHMVFVSFGDPYKLFDFPYLHTYVNAYSDCPETQRAVAKAVTGQIAATGKNPVSFDGFFEREI